MEKEEEPAAAWEKRRGALLSSRRRRPGAGEGKAYALSRGVAAAGRGPPLRHPLPLRAKPRAPAAETPEAALRGAAAVVEGATGRKDVCSLSSSSSISRKSGRQRQQPRLRCTLRTAAAAAAAPWSLGPLPFASLLLSLAPPQWRRLRRAPSKARRAARAAGACRPRRLLRRSRTRSSSRSRKKCRRRWRSFERKTRLLR